MMRNNPSKSYRSTTKHSKGTHPQQPLESIERSIKLYGSTSKKRQRTYSEQPFQSNFERLPTDVLKFIFTRLSLSDLIRVTAVSSFLKSSVEAFKDYSRFFKSPWFIVPPNEGERGSCLIMNVEEKKFHRLKKRTSDVFSKFPLVGSSQRWLIFSDHTTFTLFLLNPFTEVRIQLPSLKPFFNVSEIEELDYPGHYTVLIGNKWTARKTDDQIQRCLVKTAILTTDPTHSKDFGVALISDDGKRLGYYKNGSHGWWTELIAGGTYIDILCSKSKLYALCFLGSTTFIDSWGLQGNCRGLHSKKRTPFTCPPKISRVCLVGSEGDILLVGCNYFSGMFHVFKLDFGRRKWVEVKSLGDQSILYLRRSQSILVSTKDLQTCRGNSIYFTTWSLKGHIIIKMYKLRDGNKFTVKFESKNIQLKNLPWWVIAPSSFQSNA